LEHRRPRRYSRPIGRHSTFHRFGIVGYGHFGEFLARSLAGRRRDVIVTDVARDRLPSGTGRLRAGSFAEVAGCDVVLLAVPAAALTSTLDDLRPLLQPDTVVMDVVSTKTRATALLPEVLTDHPNLLATHPLFGPPSMRRMQRGQRLVVTFVAGERARAFLDWLHARYGLEILDVDADDHDRAMAYMQALPFFIARALVSLQVDHLPHVPNREQLSLPSFEQLERIAAIEHLHTDDMFETCQQSNPYAHMAREQLIDALTRLHAELAEGRVSGEVAPADPSDLQADAPVEPPPVPASD
jgi:prephenate dehydrogenase